MSRSKKKRLKARLARRKLAAHDQGLNRHNKDLSYEEKMRRQELHRAREQAQPPRRNPSVGEDPTATDKG